MTRTGCRFELGTVNVLSFDPFVKFCHFCVAVWFHVFDLKPPPLCTPNVTPLHHLGHNAQPANGGSLPFNPGRRSAIEVCRLVTTAIPCLRARCVRSARIFVLNPQLKRRTCTRQPATRSALFETLAAEPRDSAQPCGRAPSSPCLPTFWCRCL